MSLVFALMTLVVAWPAASASAYESETHRELAARSASPEVSAIDAVLKTDLGLREGVRQPLLGSTVEKLVGLGAAREDEPDYCSLNHFHNPLLPWRDAGLSVGWGLLARGTSSVLWQQTLEQDRASVRIIVPLREGGGDWSWQDTGRRHLDALTGADRAGRLNSRPSGREQTFAEGFLGLGHLTHLIQDATVPAHVRNDAHPDAVRFIVDGDGFWRLESF